MIEFKGENSQKHYEDVTSFMAKDKEEVIEKYYKQNPGASKRILIYPEGCATIYTRFERWKIIQNGIYLNNCTYTAKAVIRLCYLRVGSCNCLPNKVKEITESKKK